jgi:hypothetical protein
MTEINSLNPLKKLKETERNEGILRRGTELAPRENQPPTLAELGLDKKTSKLAQDIAELPSTLHRINILSNKLNKNKKVCIWLKAGFSMILGNRRKSLSPEHQAEFVKEVQKRLETKG